VSALVLVEFQEDCAEAIRLGRAERCTLIPLSAEAVQALDDSGVAADAWFDPGQQRRDDRLAEENLARLERLVAAVDAAASSQMSDAERAGFSFARCWGQHLLLLLNALAFRADALVTLLERHGATRVLWFTQPGDISGPPVWSPGESVWSDVCGAAAVCTFGGVEWQAIAGRAGARQVRRRIARAGAGGSGDFAAAAAGRVTARVAGAVRRAAGRVRRTAPMSSPAGPTAVVLGAGNEIDRAAAVLDTYRLIRWPAPPIPASLALDPAAVSEIADASLASAGAGGLFRWSAFDAMLAVRARWSAWFTRRYADTLGTYVAARRQLAAAAPAFVLHGEIGPDWARRTTLEAAGALGIPRIFYQWGGNYGYMRQPYLAAAELRSERMLTYTDAVSHGMDRGARRGTVPLPRMRAVGSLYFAETAPAFRSAPGADRIVYAPSALTGPYRYGPYLCVDDTAFYRIERRIVAALAHRFPGRLVVKLHPWNRLAVDPIARWIRRRRIAAELTAAPIERVARGTAVWIIDGLATVLQQAVFSGRPVVYVHMGGSSPLAEAEPAIRASVEWLDGWSDDLEVKLADAVERGLAAPSGSPAVFAEGYVGTAPRERVAAHLRAALGESGASREPASTRSSFAP
jgi:hypothetical protein